MVRYDWPGNLRQLENTTAQLCELGDMQEKQLIDEEIVTSILHTRSATRSDAGSDIIARAAFELAQGAVRLGVGSINTGVGALVERIRQSALDACGGNIEQAAQMIQDHPTALGLFAESGPSSRSGE